MRRECADPSACPPATLPNEREDGFGIECPRNHPWHVSNTPARVEIQAQREIDILGKGLVRPAIHSQRYFVAQQRRRPGEVTRPEHVMHEGVVHPRAVSTLDAYESC